MKDRLVTALGGAIALLIVFGLFFGSQGELPVTRPLSNEPGRNGYLALNRWLAAADLPVVSWRERFDRLLEGDAGLAPGGNLMITTLPHTYDLRTSEIQALNGWLRRGNTLLVLAALNDSPEWLPLANPSEFLPSLAAMTGLGFRVYEAEDDTVPVDAGAVDALAAPRPVVFEPIAHPLLDGVARLEGYTDDPTSQWIGFAVAPYSDRPFLRLAVDTATGSDAAWEITLGEGRIIVFASASLFANQQIANADNAVLAANLVAAHRAPAGAVLFDDIHHGLTTLYDPQTFYADRRLHATIGFLIAAWFVYLLATGSRIAPVRQQEQQPRQTDLIGGIGGFMARRLGRREAGLLLFDEWFDELRRWRGLSVTDEPPWQELAATPTLNPTLLARLRDDHERLAQGGVVDLVTLHNRILKAREAIG